PESHFTSELSSVLNRWSRSHVKIGALDTGAFILADAGLLKNRRATVHYEHIDAMIELYPDISVTEDLFVIDGDRFTCCGGLASADLALFLLRDICGEGTANAVARYLFHHNVRGPEISQNPARLEPFGRTTPGALRRAIDLMESNLEHPMSIPEICVALDMSQRQLSRLFATYVGKTPVLYYRDIRLDRARGLVTQTEMKLSEIAVASGFSSQTHFSRAYRERFGLPPRQDRIDGRVPFEFRAWPMHSPGRA
ncbi:MAG: helix-turn-helix domain-containing protein, partial [Pseudomonadota bacterium]